MFTALDTAMITEILIKSVMLLLLAYLFSRFLLMTSAAYRYAYWLYTLMSLLCLLPAMYFLPALELKLIIPAGSAESSDALLLPLLAIYWFVTLWLTFYLLVGIFTLFINSKKSRTCKPAQQQCERLAKGLGIRQTINVVICNKTQSPQTWGCFRPTIILPEAFMTWRLNRRKRVLLHELIHIQRHDWLSLIVTRLICALFWFNPLTWIIANRLLESAEMSCDDQVILKNGEYIEYAEDLLTIVSTNFGREKSACTDAVLSAAEGSPVFQRVQALLDNTQDRSSLTLCGKLALCVILLLFIIPISTIQATTHPARSPDTKQPISIHLTWLDENHNIDTETSNHHDSGHNAEMPDNTDILSAFPIIDVDLTDNKLEALTVTGHAVNNVLDEENKYNYLPTTTGNSHITGVELIRPQVYIRGYIPLVMVTPNYPSKAIRKNIEGQVIVQFNIDASGKVKEPVILASQPGRVFDQTVTKALKQCKFRPHLINDQPVEITGVVQKFIFRLTDEDIPPTPRINHAKPTFTAHKL